MKCPHRREGVDLVMDPDFQEMLQPILANETAREALLQALLLA